MDDLSTLPDIWAAPISRGWSVFPLEARGKKPLCEWKKFQMEPASLEQVREWTKRECNIGIVTGRISKIVVLDLDNDEAIAEAKRLGLPHTPTVRTGRGRHVYFRHPGSFDVPNAAGIFPGADIRGDGGYVVGPGSVHENGKIYTWALPPGLSDFAPLPEWMLDRLRPGIARAQADRIRNAPPGTRNDTLNRVSFETARMAIHGEVDGPDARRRLAEAAMDAGLDRHEILPTLKSGWKAGTAAEIAKDFSARPHP
jgi:putative DNA primase/helicase